MPYTTNKITEVPRLIASIPVVETAVVPKAEWKAAGINKDEIASASNDDAVWAVYS
jgi:hypothetical protein